MSLPIIPAVLLSFNIPNAILGKTHAKYKKKVVDMTLCIVLFPTTPVIRKCSGVTIWKEIILQSSFSFYCRLKTILHKVLTAKNDILTNT